METERAPRPAAELPRILLVEDSEDDALLLQHDLRSAIGPAAYRRVDSESQLREALAGASWDLVICDHWLPDLDSDRALEIVKTEAPGTPLVICSGHLDPVRAIAAMRAGANDFIDKRDRARLVPVVERELRGSRVQREMMVAQASVIELAHFDPLTRLPNRESFVRRLGSALAAPPRGQAPALLVLDIDRFRLVNESNGFEVGDALIREAAATLAAMTGDRSLTARLSQNRFAMFLPANASRRSAGAFARNLARRFSQGFRVGDCEVHFTLSIGVSLAPEHGRDAGELLRSAESAEHMAKAKGGNTIRLYDPEMNAAAARSLALENALRMAVERRELRVAYQPFVDLSTGRVTGAEALLRWDHPVLGAVGPAEFVALAEESGLIGPMGQWALERALADTKAIRERGHADFRIAVNVSPAQFRYAALAEEVQGALERASLPPDALELEITESLALDDSARTVAALAALRRSGVRLAIDDFGTGFASLGALKRFAFDTLKIDKGFIAGLPQSKEDGAIVASLAALARGLGVTLHAEGVETAAQGAWLREAGCVRAQGYYLGTPASAGELLRQLEAG